jgi:hypothetical protein
MIIFEYVCGGHCIYVQQRRRLQDNSGMLHIEEVFRPYTLSPTEVFSPLKITPLWRVSRQLHHETALLPYSANTWNPTLCPWMFETFLSRLSRTQLHAIKSLQFSVANFRVCKFLFPKSATQSFFDVPGLRRLFFEFPTSGGMPRSSEEGWRAYLKLRAGVKLVLSDSGRAWTIFDAADVAAKYRSLRETYPHLPDEQELLDERRRVGSTSTEG